MRFYTVLSSRPTYYDRNPLDVLNSFAAGGTAPHTITTRFTYTVPTARKAYIEMLQVEVLRDGVAGTPGRPVAAIRVTPFGGAQTSVLLAEFITNTLGDRNTEVVGSTGLLLAADVAVGTTQDDSTTGTVRYLLTMKATEFDA